MLGVMEEAPVSPGSSGDAASPSKVFRSAVGSPAAGSRGSLVPSVEYVDAYSEILRWAGQRVYIVAGCLFKCWFKTSDFSNSSIIVQEEAAHIC